MTLLGHSVYENVPPLRRHHPGACTAWWQQVWCAGGITAAHLSDRVCVTFPLLQGAGQDVEPTQGEIFRSCRLLRKNMEKCYCLLKSYSLTLFGLFPARSMRLAKLHLEHISSTLYLSASVPSRIATRQITRTSSSFHQGSLDYQSPSCQASPFLSPLLLLFSLATLLFQGLACRFAFEQLHLVIGSAAIAPKLLAVDKVSAVTNRFTGF